MSARRRLRSLRRFLADFGPLAQLPPPSRLELEEHVEELGRMRGDPGHKELFDHLYGCLSILDSKSSSLLAFNSIIIAVFAIFLSEGLTPAERVAVGAGMATIVVSCFLLLTVVWVHWSTTDHLRYTREHAVTLLGVRRTRTILYRVAWYCSVAAMVALSAFLVARIG